MDSSFEEGRELEKKGEYYLAAEKYQNALSENPSSVKYLQSIAALYHKMGDWKQALEAYRKAAQIYPTDVGYYRLGECYARCNQIPKALMSLRKSLEMNPRYVNSHLLLAKLYGQAGNDYKKEIYLRNILIIDGDNTEAAEGLIQIYIKNFRYRDAFFITEKMEEKFGLSRTKRIQFEILCRMGKYNVSKVYLEDIFSSDPNLHRQAEKYKSDSSRRNKAELELRKRISDLKDILRENISPDPDQSMKISMLALFLGKFRIAAKYYVYARELQDEKKIFNHLT